MQDTVLKHQGRSAMQARRLTTAEFLDALASGEPTPGGGGAAALTASQAAALLGMVLNFTVGKARYAEVEAEMRGYLTRTEALRQTLLDQVDEDAAAFGGVAASYAMPKGTDHERALRAEALEMALRQAAAVPQAVAEGCLELVRLAEPIGARGNRHVVSDAATALYLADGALRSALMNVRINLKSIKDADFVAAHSARATTLLAEAEQARARAQQAIERSLGVPL
jgi:formiminotetrahydrofolate cyclodeaminase